MIALESKEAKIKLTITYVILIVAVSYLLGNISVQLSESALSWFSHIIQLTTFILLGMFHVTVLSKGARLSHSNFFFSRQMLTLLLSFLIFLILLFTYLIIPKGQLVMALASASAFFLPAILNTAWLFFLKNFQETPQLFYENAEKAIGNKNVVYLDVISIKLILVKELRYKEEIYSIKLSRTIPFRILFQQFLDSLTDEYLVNSGESAQRRVAWFFILRNWKGIGDRYINPNLSLAENRVKNNCTVIAKQVACDTIIKSNSAAQEDDHLNTLNAIS